MAALVAGCTDNATCANTACAADGSAGLCGGAWCAAEFGRCACPGAAALRRADGGCDAAVDEATCEASHDVVFVVGTWGGPELAVGGGPEDASGPFGTMLRRSVAAALQRAPGEVAVFDVRRLEFEGDLGDLGDLQEVSSRAGLVMFDWAFSFCAVGGARTANGDSLSSRAGVDPNDFERGFSVHAQSYAAFAQASMRVLTLTAREVLDSTESAVSAGQSEGSGGGVSSGSGAEGGSADARALLQQFWWVPWTLAGCACVALCSAWVVLRRRRRLSKAALGADSLPEDLMLGPGGSLLRCLPAPAATRVQAVRDFGGPEDMAGDDICLEGYLLLIEGDLVEVLAASSDWLYGRLLNDPDRAGFFPESCIASVDLRSASNEAGDFGGDSPMVIDVGPPAAAAGDVASRRGSAQSLGGSLGTRLPMPRELAARELAASGHVVRVACAFSPDEVQNDDSGLRERCLALSGGESVEVLAAGGGWLFGRVVDQPTREGYFPEDRADWNGSSPLRSDLQE